MSATYGPWEPVDGFRQEQLLYEQRVHNEFGAKVARLVFNRPERLNALTREGFQDLYRALDDASHDPDVGVVVLTSVGDRAFCTGGDVKAESEGLSKQVFRYEPPPNHFLRACQKPIIAAVKGYAIGGGNHFAYFCDFTIAAENAVFGQTGAKVGSPADGYFVAYLTRVVGAKKAREIWMLCRKYSAAEALDMGLVNAVVPLDDLDREVEQWCSELLQKSPTVLRILKASFDADIDYMVAQSHRLSDLMAPDFIESAEQREGQLAFLEKRTPNFWRARRA